MANFYCKCGNRLNNSMAPNDIEWRVYSDKEWDDIINIGMMDSVDMPDPSIEVWRCPKCERVYEEIFRFGEGRQDLAENLIKAIPESYGDEGLSIVERVENISCQKIHRSNL